MTASFLPTPAGRRGPPGVRLLGWLLLLAVGITVPCSSRALDDPGEPWKVVFDGNSLTSGIAGMNPADTYPSQCARLLGTNWQAVNAGLGGLSTFEMLRRAPAEIDARHRRTTPNSVDVLVVWEGSNDFAQNSATVDAAFTRLTEYARARRAAGWRVVMVTVLPRLAGPTFEIDRQALNARLREGWHVWADALADVAADPEIGAAGCAGDRKYYLDGTHLNAAGNARVARVVRDVLVLLPPGTKPDTK